jgi:WD40 repeat protein
VRYAPFYSASAPYISEHMNQYYEKLELKPGASPEEIKQAYRKLVKEWHPDRFPDEPQRQQEAEEKIKEINEAYEYLKAHPVKVPKKERQERDKKVVEAEYHYHRGVKKAKQESYKEALEHFSQAIFYRPDYVDAYKYRGFVYSILGKDRKANADLRRVGELRRKWGQPSTYSPPDRHVSVPNPNTPWSCAGTLRSHTNIVSAIAIDLQGRIFASSSYDGTVRLWQLSTGQQLRVFQHGEPVYCVAISPDSRTIASGGKDRTIKLWNAQTGQHIRTLGGWFGGHADTVLTVAFHPDRKRLASGSADRTVRLWKLNSGKELRQISGYSHAITSLAISPDGSILVTGSLEKAIKIRQFGSGQLVRSLRESYKILTVAFSPNGETFASGGSDGIARLWDLKSGRVLQTFSEHSDFVSAVSFSKDGKILLSGDGDGNIKLWQVETGEEICTLSEHGDRIMSVALSPGGNSLVSCSADRTIKIWWRSDTK